MDQEDKVQVNWVMRIILCGLAAFGIFSTTIYLPTLPAIVTDLKTDQASVQLTLTFFFLGSSVGQIFLGPLSDYYGRLKIAYWGISIFIISTLAATMTESITSFIFWRLIQGLSASTGPLLSRAICRDLFSGPQLIRMMSSIMMVISVSPALAPVIGGYLQVHFGWHYSFYFLSLSAVFVFVLLLSYLPETNRQRFANDIHPVSILKGYSQLLGDTRFLGYFIILGGLFAAMFVFITMSPFIFQKVYGWSPEEFAWVSAMITVGNIIGFGTANRLAGKKDPNLLIFIGASLAILTAAYIVFQTQVGEVGEIMLLMYLLVFAGFTSIGAVNASSSAMNLFPKMAGRAAALIGAVQIGAGALGSAVAGIVEDDPYTLALSMGSFVFVGLVIFCALRLRSRIKAA